MQFLIYCFDYQIAINHTFWIHTMNKYLFYFYLKETVYFILICQVSFTFRLFSTPMVVTKYICKRSTCNKISSFGDLVSEPFAD